MKCWKTIDLPAPSSDISTVAVFSFFHGLGAPDLVGLQAVVLSSAGAIQATSTTTIL